MPVTRLNHAVLYVRDVERTREFYENVLGFKTLIWAPGQAAPSPAGRSAVGLYHLAWEVDTLDELGRIAEKLTELDALAGASDHATTKSLYAHDPDGLEFEVAWVVPAALLTEDVLAARSGIRPLDLAAEKQRYGGQTRGGLGVSIPA